MMIKASTLAVALAVVGPLTFAGPVLSAAATLKEAPSASPRHYWNYAPDRAYPSNNSYYDEDYWKAVGPLTPKRDPYAGTYFDNVYPY
jgi:hypothetical protein